MQQAEVIRPDRGLGRGVWEAPTWFFIVVAILAIAIPAVHFARRRYLERKAKAMTLGRLSSIPPSSMRPRSMRPPR